MVSQKLDSKLYATVVRITQIYLGPAADRFIARQVQSHLHKTPDQISKAELLVLIDWIKLAMSLLTEDADIIEEYTSQLRRLASPPKAKHSRS